MVNTLNGLLAAELRAEKARQQISGRELARRVRKPETTVARYLRGGTAMNIDDIEEFAKALGVTTVDLIARAYGAPEPPPSADMHSRDQPPNPCLLGSRVIIGPWRSRRAARYPSVFAPVA